MPTSVAPKRQPHITADVEIVFKAQSSLQRFPKLARRRCTHITRPHPLIEMRAERLPPHHHPDSSVVQVALTANDPYFRSYESKQALRHRQDYLNPLP